MGVLLLAKTGLEGTVDTPLLPQLETILLPMVWKYGFLTAPKAKGRFNRNRPTSRAASPSNGGGISPPDRLIADDMPLSECE